MTLGYTIEFLDYWHIGSGLSAGARIDNTVVKDSKKMPYMPGKTIKGLAREMAEYFDDCDFVNTCFGGSSDKEDKCFQEKSKRTEGACYFSNATIKDDIAKEIIEHTMQDSLYEIITSTKIGQEDRFNKEGKQIEKAGIAVDHSLRETEVVVPVTLHGAIENVPDQYADKLTSSLEMIKRVGLNRNRGLGRCRITAKEA